jgi:ubiquinol-cytochrome c reductase cytochrome c1 subunit
MLRGVRWLAAGISVLGLAGPAWAVGESVTPIDRSWSTDGIFGTFDRAALQRGLQVYREVCQSCHGLGYLSFRNLDELGFSAEEVQAIAADYVVNDGPDDTGLMFERPGRPSDPFPPPFPNDAAARTANGGALPPDVSLIVKARAGGADYLYSLLVGYAEPPADVEVPDGLYYNTYFPGHLIAMPPPLFPDQVSYADGTPATVAQMASDVTQFLHFAAEPKLEERKQTGLKAMLFLVVFAGIFYAYKRKIWSDLH